MTQNKDIQALIEVWWKDQEGYECVGGTQHQANEIITALQSQIVKTEDLDTVRVILQAAADSLQGDAKGGE